MRRKENYTQMWVLCMLAMFILQAWLLSRWLDRRPKSTFSRPFR